MAFEEPQYLRSVPGLDGDMPTIRAFMQGAIYCWVKIHADQPNPKFAVRDLVGGLNSDWTDTPLQPLHNRHIEMGKSFEEACTEAARDLGWIVKSLLAEDPRLFSVQKAYVNEYEWIQNR